MAPLFPSRGDRRRPRYWPAISRKLLFFPYAQCRHASNRGPRELVMKIAGKIR